ncbi:MULTISPECIES: outer surface protein [Bacillus]|uniref:Outer surface protein n=1 Tax=Bacillus anthracis TaxID=1392 RepID=A0A2B0Y6M8_BACAN|nr:MULTISPECIES: outer surface protein [Bacillus]MCU0094177.1 outer surface protein [Bacillus sp. OR9]MBJ8060167.1 outer surface protein [Bacillus cereus]MCU4758786.1 outer surface protein [Bacillus cereus]MCU5107858.1 outer surface protein [Bacillus cereus]MCU5340738.1 outer surface protein [Bacillus cereus]
MKVTKGKVIGVMIFLLLCIPFTAWKESKVKDFPVSIFSFYVEDENPKDYKYTAFVPDFAVWIGGWEKQQSEGEITSYKKGDRTVIVHHPPDNDGFYLYDTKEIREYTQP